MFLLLDTHTYIYTAKYVLLLLLLSIYTKNVAVHISFLIVKILHAYHIATIDT